MLKNPIRTSVTFPHQIVVKGKSSVYATEAEVQRSLPNSLQLFLQNTCKLDDDLALGVSMLHYSEDKWEANKISYSLVCTREQCLEKLTELKDIIPELIVGRWEE